MERRGARDVWPSTWAATDVGIGEGFSIAARALSSGVERRLISAYDPRRRRAGTFDVVVASSLLLHLPNPVLALEALRRVCRGWFLTSEPVAPWLTLVARNRPLARLLGSGDCVGGT